MKIYNYHPQSGEFISEGIAQENPLEPGKFLVPAHATKAEPPVTQEGKAVAFQNGGWVLEDDQRGEIYYDETGQEVKIKDIGQTVPAGASRTAPPKDGCVWENGAWTLPEPTSDEVNQERDRRINAGFTFNGKVYDFDPRSKANISGAAQMAFMAIVAGAQVGNLRWNGGAVDFGWIAADNSLNTMDAQTVVNFGKAAAAHEQVHIFAARAIKSLDPIPQNYASDENLWP